MTVEMKRQEEIMNKRAFSYMSGDQIRWMSKRKPSASSAAKGFVPPSRVLQLRAIFKGLDFDGSGEISLQELKDAVRYVASSKVSSGPPLIKDPEGIATLFESMDIDGNGVVDFEEFLLGMTSSEGSGNANDIASLQNAFYDFANQHRRTMIIDKMKDGSIPVVERYAEFRKLYAIKFHKAEMLGGVTTEDLIKSAQKDAAAEQGEMSQASKHIRHKELVRARAAAISHHETMRQAFPKKDGPYPVALRGYIGSTIPSLANKGAGVYKSRKYYQGMGTSKSLEELKREKFDEDTHSLVTQTVANSMCKFSLPKESTHLPPLSLSRSSSGFAALAGKDAHKMRSGIVDIHRDVLAPPVSIREAIIQRAKDSRLDFDQKREHHHHHHHHYWQAKGDNNSN